jgi:DNA-binding NtrC family response regulator
MKRRILLVDDDVAILLTLKAVLEISGFEVTTAASAREAKQKLKSNEYHMVITDLRMESETAGEEVAAAAKGDDVGHGQGSGEADEHAGSAAAD